MCGHNFQIDPDRARDLLRGRFKAEYGLTPDRFWKLEDYAYRRWEKTRNLHHSKFWLSIIRSVKRRRGR